MTCSRPFGIINITKLWKHIETLPTFEFQITDLDYMLDVGVWETGTPNEIYIYKTKEDTEHHHDRILHCDTAYPIVITEHKYENDEIPGRWDILDGLHRLCKLKYLDNATHVSVKIVSMTILGKCVI